MKIAIEIDVGKLLAVVVMAICVWLASICGEGETLLFIIPAGLYYIFGKENTDGNNV